MDRRTLDLFHQGLFLLWPKPSGTIPNWSLQRVLVYLAGARVTLPASAKGLPALGSPGLWTPGLSTTRPSPAMGLGRPSALMGLKRSWLPLLGSSPRMRDLTTDWLRWSSPHGWKGDTLIPCAWWRLYGHICRLHQGPHDHPWLYGSTAYEAAPLQISP